MQRYNSTNKFSLDQTDPAYPLWGAQLKNFMWAVRDADLCLLRRKSAVHHLSFVAPVLSTETLFPLSQNTATR